MINKILDWINDIKTRHFLIREFNKKAKESYVQNQTSTLLKAKTSIGFSEFEHSLSKFMGGGFNIKAFSSIPLGSEQLKNIGNDLIKDEIFLRKLISLGWDTLEVQDLDGIHCYKWELKKFLSK